MADANEATVPNYYTNFDFAIFSIFTALVFEIGAQFGADRKKLQHSEHWGGCNNNNNNNNKRFNRVMSHVRVAALQAIAVALLFIIASAIGIGLTTRNLEERMRLILNGLSGIAAAVVFGTLSFGIAVWTGLYYCVWSPIEPATSKSLRQVKFKVRCGYYRIFTRYYFFLLPFYEGVTAWKIPVSMLAGIALGLFLGYGIYLARRKGHGCWQNSSKFVVVIFMCLFSSIFLANAAWYITSVWSSETEREDAMAVSYTVFFFVGFIGLILLHTARYCYSRQSQQKHAAEEQILAAASSPDGSHKSSVKRSANSNLLDSNRPRMAASLIVEAFAFSKTKEGQEVAAAAAEAPSSSLKSLQVQEQEEEGDGEAEKEEDEDIEIIDSDEPSLDDADADAGDDNDQQPKEGPETVDSTNQIEQQKEADRDPTYMEMLSRHWRPCCGCLRGKDLPLATKAWSFMSWTVWLCLVLFCLYLVIINIGATAQQMSSKAKFPEVNRILYSTMDLGPVCAFDNKGADSNITTFPDKDAAHAAGFLIVHCGPCAACSDWHNLRLEYTTRNSLAQDSRKCAQKSLLPGGFDAVLECMEAPPIEFRGECARCWTDDVLCAKSHCALIFMQSTLIKAVTDLAVNKNSITSAACEEANCEAGNPGKFVECSGATRRRMNVTSDIARPGGQRCSIVDVNWAELFPGE